MSRKKHTSALVLLNDREITTTNAAELEALKSSTIAQLNEIRRLDRETSARWVVVGCYLLRVRYSMKHGQFIPWIEANAPFKIRACNYAMRLAQVFIDRARVTKPDLLALPGDQSTFQFDAPVAAEGFLKKLADFVGSMTLAQLLDKYDIKPSAALVGAAKDDNEPPAPPPTPEQLYQQSRDEIGSVISRAESLLLSENRLQYLIGHPEEIRGTAKSLRDLAEKVEAIATGILKTQAA